HLLPGGQPDGAAPALRAQAGDLDGSEHFHAVPAGLRDEPVGQVAAADPLREARVVLDPLGDPGLAAQAALVDHDRVDALAGGVDGGGQPGRSAADDHQVVAGPVGDQAQAELGRQLVVTGLDRVAAVGEGDRRDRPAAILQSLNAGETVRILVDINPFERYPVLREKLLRALAVGAPRSAVD